MEYGFREYEAPVRTARKSREKEPEKKSILAPTLATQFAVFIILGVILFFMYRSQSASFNSVKDMFGSVMQYDMTYSEIGDKIYSVFSRDINEENTQTQTEPQTEAGTEKEQTTEATGILTAADMGAGGEDLIYAKENASFSPFYLSEEIVMPVSSKRTTSPFGYRINPVTNEYGFHSGLDIAAAEGSDIRAAFEGIVEKASSSPARGNYIFLQSGNIKTVYCHCSKLLVKEGDEVKAGQVIAKVGHTGQATGPHLHFEIRINDVYYNPLWVLNFNGD